LIRRGGYGRTGLAPTSSSAIETDLTATATPARPTLLKRMRNAFGDFKGGVERGIERFIASKSLVATSEIIPNEAFPWTGQVEASWRTIRAELEGVIGDRTALPNMQDISPTQYGIVRDKVWKVFAFNTYGAWSQENCRACPETAKLLRSIPDLKVAFFSVLEPGAHISAHRGAYKGLVRAHLGLIVPEPNADVRMAVGKEMIHWREGELVLFDDTYRHEVWNDTDGVRVVLLFDVERPFPPMIRALNRTVLGAFRLAPFVTGAVKKLNAWERDHYKKAA